MIRNVGSNATLNIYRTVLQFALQLALTYFVPPADYGLVALITPVTLLVLMVGDFGLTSAIVRTPDVAAEALGGAARVSAATAALTLGCTAGVAATGLLDLVAPRFGLLCLGFAVVVGFALLCAVPRALFERRLDYGRIALIESGVATIAFVTAVTCAWAGAGVWSYLVYHLTLQALRFAAMWSIQRRRIEIGSGSIRAALPLLGIGGWILASNIVNFVARNGDNYIVGGILGSSALGVYAVAYQVMLLPVQTLTWPVSSVLTATLSRLHDRPDRQRDAMLSTLSLIAYLGLPAGVFLYARAPLLLTLLFPARWHLVGDIAAPLALAGCIQSVTAFSGPLLVAHGQLRLQLGISFVSTGLVLAVVTAAALVGRGLMPIADAYLLLSLVQSVFFLWLIGRILGSGTATVLKTLSGGALSAIGGLMAMLLLLTLVPHPSGGLLDAAISIGGFGLGWIAVIVWRQGVIRQLLGQMQAAGAISAELVEINPRRAT